MKIRSFVSCMLSLLIFLSTFLSFVPVYLDDRKDIMNESLFLRIEYRDFFSRSFYSGTRVKKGKIISRRPHCE